MVRVLGKVSKWIVEVLQNAGSMLENSLVGVLVMVRVQGVRALLANRVVPGRGLGLGVLFPSSYSWTPNPEACKD